MISFIVPARNEHCLISGTLGALHDAARAVNERYEIVVVDDASTDGTSVVAADCGARVLRVHHRQIAAARNAGAAQAHGDLFVFVDADTQVNGAVILAAVNALRDGVVGGGAWARFDGQVPFCGQVLAWLWRWLQRFGHFACGCFIFCTRPAFEAVGGFDETLYAAEDLALSEQLKRLGRFVILREVVITSGRYMRSSSAFETLSILFGFAWRGMEFFKIRRGPWYDRCKEVDGLGDGAP